MNPGIGGGDSLRALIFQAGMGAVQSAGDTLKGQLEGMTGQGKSMDTAQSLQLQFQVGEYSNLTQTVTGIEKMMKDSIAASARNLS